MAFPTTSVLDNFNRADGGLGANWSTDVLGNGYGSLIISSNLLARNLGAGQDNWWNPGTFGPTSEVFADIVTRATSQIRLYLRITSPGTGATNGYLYYPNPADARVYRVDTSSLTQLGAVEAVTYASGDSLGLSMSGAVLLTHKKTGGVWSDGVTRTDSTYSAAGNIGIGIEDDDACTMDNFGGGTTVDTGLAWIRA